MHTYESREDREALFLGSNDILFLFFLLQSVFGRDVCSVFMAVTLPSSLVRVNKGRGWQVVAAMLSNFPICELIYLCMCSSRRATLTLHTYHHMYFTQTCTQESFTLYESQHVCTGSVVDNQYICLASNHNPLVVFHVNLNSAMSEHKNVRYGWTWSNTSPIKEYHSVCL